MVRKNALDHFGLRVLENALLSEHIFREQLGTLCSEAFSERGEEDNSLPLKLRASKSKNKMASTEEDHCSVSEWGHPTGVNTGHT